MKMNSEKIKILLAIHTDKAIVSAKKQCFLQGLAPIMKYQ
jgi:hypothetical protein